MTGHFHPPTHTLCADFFNSAPYQLLHIYSSTFTYAHPVSDWILYPGYDGKVRFYFARPEDEHPPTHPTRPRFTMSLEGVFDGKERGQWIEYGGRDGVEGEEGVVSVERPGLEEGFAVA